MSTYNDLEQMISLGTKLVRMGGDPVMVAAQLIKTPRQAFMCADMLDAPKAGQVGSQWFAVKTEGFDTAYAAALMTGLSALSYKLSRVGRELEAKS